MPPKKNQTAAKVVEAAAETDEKVTSTQEADVAKGKKVAPKRQAKKPVAKVDEEVEDEVEVKSKRRKPKTAKAENGDGDEKEAEPKVAVKSKRGRKVAAAPVEEEKVFDDETDEESVASNQSSEKSEEAAQPKRKARKAAARPKEVVDNDEEDAEIEEDVVPKKKGRGRAAAQTKETVKKAAPKRKGKAEDKSDDELQKETETNFSKIEFACAKKNAEGNESNFKLVSWNVDGLRAWVKKEALEYIALEDPDIICLQETKCSEDKLPKEIVDLQDYKKYWAGSDKAGYAGVGILSKIDPIEVKYGVGDVKQDEDGRCIIAEFKDFYLVNVYVPNAGRKLVTLPKRLEWNKAFKTMVEDLDKLKPVIICGDMNVAHNEIDLANPKTNQKNAGFTAEEREGMTEFLSAGFVDTFRKFYPEEKDKYTFWTYMMKSRSKNVGWRLDYFLVSERLMETICDNVIRHEVFGSDHCPICLFMTV